MLFELQSFRHFTCYSKHHSKDFSTSIALSLGSVILLIYNLIHCYLLYVLDCCCNVEVGYYVILQELIMWINEGAVTFFL